MCPRVQLSESNVKNLLQLMHGSRSRAAGASQLHTCRDGDDECGDVMPCDV